MERQDTSRFRGYAFACMPITLFFVWTLKYFDFSAPKIVHAVILLQVFLFVAVGFVYFRRYYPTATLLPSFQGLGNAMINTRTKALAFYVLGLFIFSSCYLVITVTDVIVREVTKNYFDSLRGLVAQAAAFSFSLIFLFELIGLARYRTPES